MTAAALEQTAMAATLQSLHASLTRQVDIATAGDPLGAARAVDALWQHHARWVAEWMATGGDYADAKAVADAQFLPVIQYALNPDRPLGHRSGDEARDAALSRLRGTP